MSFKKGMFVGAFTSGLIIVGSMFSSTSTSINQNTNILPELQLKNSGEFHISSLDDLNEMNQLIQSGAQVQTLVLDEDLDLSGMSSSDLEEWTNNNVPGEIAEIDGQGHSIKNKPTELFLQPIFGTLAADNDFGGKLYIHNITFDNAPLVFNEISTHAISDSLSSNNEVSGGGVDSDRTLDDSKLSQENSIYLQNISIINTDISNQVINLPDLETVNIGLLSNSVRLNERYIGIYGPEFDTAITIYGLNLSNNKINNNIFNTSSLTKMINFSLTTNFLYQVCDDKADHHIGLVSFKNILIQNNEFTGNEFVGISSDAVFSFSPLISSFVFEKDKWIGSAGNFLKMESILIQNNSFEKPINISMNNFKYSDLISQSVDETLASSLYTDVESLQEIISLNNNIYLDMNSQKYYENPTVISIANVGLNSWTQEDADKLFFIGNSYDKDEELNLFIDESGNANFNNIYHSKTLNKFDDASQWNDMLMMLQRKFGIYGSSMRPNNNDDLEEIEIGATPGDVDGTDGENQLGNQDHVDVIEVVPMYDSKGYIEGLKINFNLLLSTENNVDDAGEVIDEPVTINNVKMLNNGEVIANSSQNSYEAVDITNMNYSFDVDFTFDEPISNFNVDDYESLQLTFNYTNEVTRFARNTVADLDAQELADFAAINKAQEIQDDGLAISAGVLGGIIGLILLILLILLLLLLLRRRQVEKVKEVQDGYYEFDEGPNIGFDDNLEYDPNHQYYEYDDSYDYDSYEYDDSYDVE